MALAEHWESSVLAQLAGDVAPTVPATFEVGLVLQAGQLSTALVAGTATTSLACATDTVAYALAAGDILLMGTNTQQQAVKVSAAAIVGATSITVDSFVPNSSYAIGTPFIRCDAYAVAQEPSTGGYARVAVTNNATNFPAPVLNGTSPGYTSTSAVAVTFPQATAAQGTVAGFLLGDNATPGLGNLFVFGMLNAAQAISTGNTPSIASGALTISAY